MMRQQGVLASEANDDDDAKIVIHINHYTHRIKTPAKDNRRDKDTFSRKNKKRPAEDQSSPPKKRRRSETDKEKNILEWNCGNCAHSFSTWIDYKAHVKRAHKETQEKTHENTRSQCGHCEKSFSSPQNLRRHIRTAHSPHANTRRQCGRYGKTLSSAAILQRHIRTVHAKDEKTKPQCGLCGQRCSSSGNLRRHMGTVHSTGEITKPECGRCGKRFTTKTNLISHIRTLHSTNETTKPQCDDCGKCFSTKSHIISHIKTVHSTNENTKLQCDHCGKSFSSKPYIISHIRTVHSTHEKIKQQCKHCEKSFSTPANLRRHIGTAHSPHENTRWQCRHCRQNLSSAANLQRHIRAVHSTDEKTKPECDHFSSTGNLNRHVTMEHSGEQPKEAAVAARTGVMKENSRPTETPKKLALKITMHYECKCGKTEDTYDASVRHAQEHLVQLEALIGENGTGCELKFDRHNRGDNNKQASIRTKFDYKALFTKSWFNMFQPTEWSSHILASSLYKYTRCVKLNWDSDKKEGEGHCTPLYRCGACGRFVQPAKVENHCESYRACVALGPRGHKCPQCEIYFHTAKALSLHEEDHKTHKDLRFRIVTFNNEGDVQFNRASKQMSVLFAEYTQTTEQEEISREPERSKVNKLNRTNDVQHTFHEDDVDDDFVVPVVKYCAQCRIRYSAMNKHPSCPSCLK